MPRVSIIIPVYNVEPYIDQCLESVTGQTYEDIEIIIINDGSTDGSPAKCEEWAAKDSRIVYVSQENQGAGPARNRGIRMAKADFVAFCDPDDWYDLRYIEVMIAKQEETDADIVICGYYNYDEELSKIVSVVYCDSTSLRSEFLGSNHMVWIKLIEKTLLLSNDITMPPCFGQDTAIHCYITVNARRIAVVDVPLYFYRNKRVGSAVSNYSNHAYSATIYITYCYELFLRDGSFDKYRKWLYRFGIGTVFSLSEKMKRLDNDFTMWKRDCLDHLDDFFPEMWGFRNLRFYSIGSYSLYNTLARRMVPSSDSIDEYSFSGLISIMSENRISTFPEGDNTFRKKALTRDLQKQFINDIKENCNDFIFIDFLEERFDIIEYCGGYYTASDAICAYKSLIPNHRIINRYSEEATQLWKQSCIDFIALLQKYFDPNRVILVKNFLSEHYGLRGKEFPFANVEKIQLANKLINDCYSFFLQNYPGVYVVKPESEEFQYTFQHFRHGCYPWHYNNEYYFSIGDQILDYVLGDIQNDL